MNIFFKKKAKLLREKQNLYKSLLDLDPEGITDDELDIIHMLSKDSGIKYMLQIKSKSHDKARS